MNGMLRRRVRNLRNDVAIAGALAATGVAIVAVLALFVLVGRWSQRRAEAGATSIPQSIPAGPRPEAPGEVRA